MRVLLAGMALLLSGGAARADTLWQVWQEAQANDPAFQAAAAQLRAAATGQPGALAALLPHFVLAGGAGPAKDSMSSPEFYGAGFEPIRETEKLGVSTWQATLTQNLFDWGALKTYQASGFAVQAAAASYQAQLEQLNVTVVTDYVAAAAAQADLAALREAAAGFQGQYHDAQAKYRAGMDGVIGADEALAAAQSIQLQMLQAEQKYDAARQVLAALTADQATQTGAALPDRLAVLPAGDVGDWLDQAIDGNPTLAAAQLTAQDDAALVAAARGAYLPSVSLQLQHVQAAQGGTAGYAFLGQSISGPGNSLSQDNSVTVQFTWNVFSGGADHAAAVRAAAAHDQAVDDAASARLDVVWRIHTDFSALTIDDAALTSARAATVAAEQAVHAATDGARAGLISADDLIQDRQQLLAARLALHAAVQAAVGHRLDLAQAAGSATPAMVQNMSMMLAASDNTKGED